MEFYIGQIFLGGWNFAPRGSSDAAGQLLPIAQWSALFSLYGTMYGGDGRTTFGLPDLRGRCAINKGNGTGLANYREGQKGGAEYFTLTTAQIPSHNHPVQVQASQANANSARPSGRYIANPPSSEIFTNDTSELANIAGTTSTNTGGGQSVYYRGPYLTLQYCVAMVGIFPSRN